MTLIEQASLVLIPSGYAEDKVYSVIPSNGSGDMSFTRASNGTRINFDGLVEVCPWNLAQYSNTFNNGVWVTGGYGNLPTLTANSIANPVNGLTDAWTASFAAAGTQGRLLQVFTGLPVGVPYTYSMYVKAGTKTSVSIYSDAAIIGLEATFNLSTGVVTSASSGVTATITAMSNGWYYLTITSNILSGGNGQYGIITNPGADGSLYIYGAQLNIGSTAKPYFPTTDRLNVPRLTYQNGGGGCPSLLLEPQRTNLFTYSEDFTIWTKGQFLATLPTVTADYGISPSGVQNADRVQMTRPSGASYVEITKQLFITIGTVITFSVFIKSLIGATKMTIGGTGSSNTINLTNDWVRYTYTMTTTNNPTTFTIAINGSAADSLTADFLVWGAQVEAGAYQSSYIPTVASSATRIVDTLTKTGISSLIGQTEGVIFIDLEKTNNANTGLEGYFRLDINDGTIANRILFGFELNQINATALNGGTVYASITTTGVQTQKRIKAAFAYKSNDFVLYVNGVQIGVDTSGLIPINMANFQWGINQSTSTQTSAIINQQCFFKTRLTNSELATLTTI